MVDLLMLHRKTAVTELLDSVPKPLRALPAKALPGWENLPLANKLPMLKCPTNELFFSRNKVGQPIYSSHLDEFVLSDPYCYNVSYNYEPLHDPTLRKFFGRKTNLDRIKSIGIVTDNNEAICTLKEFNEYRRYLNTVHSNQVEQERKIREEATEDKRRYENALKIAERDFRNEEIAKRKQVKRKEIQIIKDMNKKPVKSVSEVVRKHQESKAQREKETQIRVIRAEIKKGRLRERLERKLRSEAIIRKKLILFKKKMRIADVIREKNMKLKKLQKQEENFKKAILSWQIKTRHRREQQDYDQNLLLRADIEFEKNVEKRNKKIKKLQEIIEIQTLHRKAALIRDRYEKNTLERIVRIMKNEIKRKLKRDDFVRGNIGNDMSTRAGLSPIVATYRTKEESEKGLGEAPTGYASLNDEKIRMVVESCFKVEQTLNGENFNTMEILLNTKEILDRLSDDMAPELPKDHDVMEFALEGVLNIIDEVEQKIITNFQTLIKTEHKSPLELELNKSTKSTSTVQIQRKKDPSKMSSVSFNKATQCESSVSARSKVISEGEEGKIASLRKMVRAVLNTDALDDEPKFPPQFQGTLLFHLSKKQKILILKNLKKVSKVLLLKTEQMCFARVDIKKLVTKPAQKKEIKPDDKYDTVIDNCVESVLTPPEYDKNFAKNVLNMSYYLTQEIVKMVEKFIEFFKEDFARRTADEEEIIANRRKSILSCFK